MKRAFLVDQEAFDIAMRRIPHVRENRVWMAGASIRGFTVGAIIGEQRGDEHYLCGAAFRIGVVEKAKRIRPHRRVIAYLNSLPTLIDNDTLKTLGDKTKKLYLLTAVYGYSYSEANCVYHRLFEMQRKAIFGN